MCAVVTDRQTDNRQTHTHRYGVINNVHTHTEKHAVIISASMHTNTHPHRDVSNAELGNTHIYIHGVVEL